MFNHQMSKLSPGKMMKKLIKQAGTFYDEYALFGGCDVFFISVKINTTIHREGLLFESYFERE